jgi:hypothetical protein
MPDIITKCNRPKDVEPWDWKDCERCHVANCGYSRLFEPNPHFRQQEGCCEWEHCIENYPLSRNPRCKLSCPIFGHNCPEGSHQVKLCVGQLEGEANLNYQAKFSPEAVKEYEDRYKCYDEPSANSSEGD